MLAGLAHRNGLGSRVLVYFVLNYIFSTPIVFYHVLTDQDRKVGSLLKFKKRAVSAVVVERYVTTDAW